MSTVFKGESLKLKYLFTAFFANGERIKQTEADKSKYFPHKSTFTDVLKYQESHELTRFVLNTAKPVLGLVGHEYAVDLRTGLFSINGLEFSAADQFFVPEAPLKLIYFRETRIEVDVDSETMEEKDRRHFVNRYFIGWQTMWKNKNYQCTIAIDGK